jgi:hypothetical protein
MNMKLRYWIAGVAILIAASAVSSVFADSALTLDPRSVSSYRSTFTVHLPIGQAHSVIVNTLRNLDPSSPTGERYFFLRLFGDPLFSQHGDINLAYDEQGTKQQPGGLTVDQWVKLTPEKRWYDMRIYPTVDNYWKSDYLQNGQPVEFSVSSFIVHLADVSTNDTKIAVFQTGPRVRLGKKLSVGRETLLPGFFWDIRSVDASPRATTELVEFLESALSKAQNIHEESDTRH